MLITWDIKDKYNDSEIILYLSWQENQKTPEA